MPWKTFREGDRWCVHKLNADDSKGERVKCFDSESAANDQVRALYANVNEFRGNFSDVLAITELRGAYPNVPISADVDYAALVAGDDAPVFLTLPIGKANVTSGNKRHYDEAFLQELERQTLAGKPIGLMGHLSETERATAFPAEAVHWVGAIRDGDTLWGKAYVVPGPVRDRIQRYKAQGKAIATSIDAFAEGVFDDSLKAMRMVAKTLRLNQIDIAPADRAGIPDLAAVPMLTTEMDTQPVPEIEQEPVAMDKLEIINGLTPEDARLLPKAVRDAILAEVPTPPEVVEAQELRAALGVDEKANVVQLVNEMKQAQEEARKTAITIRITELATAGIKVEAVRGLVTELVAARNPQSVEEAEAAYTTIAASAHVTELLKAQVASVMGPRQTTPVAPQAGQHKYFVIPQEA
jgi:hypothetical protein